MKNQIGNKSIINIAEKFFPNKSAECLRKFVLKDPVPHKLDLKTTEKLALSIKENSYITLAKLNKLTLCKLHLSHAAVINLGQALNNMDKLEHLDLSFNHIKHTTFAQFFNNINGKNNLKSLRCLFNSSQPTTVKPATGKPKDEDQIGSIEEELSNYLHHSSTLLHINMSGMNFSFEQIKYIFSNGLRKARTLLSVHFSGYMLKDHEMIELRKTLKVNTVSSQHPAIDTRILTRYKVAKSHQLQLKEIFGKSNPSQ